MSARVKVTDRGATKRLNALLKKGALSVGVLGAEADAQHQSNISTIERKELRALKGYVNKKRGHFVSQAQRERLAVLTNKAKASELTVGEIAAIHEFGLGTAPRRSFLADWADEKRDEINAIAVKAGRAVARGTLTGEDALEQIGAWAVGSIQERMASNIPPPLAPATIKRKGSSVALIDTGQLRSSISYRVDSIEQGNAGEALDAATEHA
jgi:hypothetical protein